MKRFKCGSIVYRQPPSLYTMHFDIRRLTPGGYRYEDVVQAFRMEPRSLLFAFRVTLAALLALWLGQLFHFRDFYWAGVTAWVMAIPGRGVVFQKAGYRAAGTAIGAAIAFCFLHLTPAPHLLVFLIGIWAGACGFMACRYRRFRAYSAQLSGYTCSIICIVGLQAPENLVTGFALERVALVMIGLACSTLLAWAFAPKMRSESLLEQARDWAANSTKWASDILRFAGQSDGESSVNHELWAGLSEFENTFVQAAFESKKFRRRLPVVREFVCAQISLLSSVRALARLKTGSADSTHAEVTDILEEASAALRRDVDTVSVARLEQLSHRLLRDSRDIVDLNKRLAVVSMAERCRDIAALLRRISVSSRLNADGAVVAGALAALPTHHDWQVSLSAGLRTAVSTVVMGLLWLKLDWPGGAYAFVFTPIACLLFGTVTRPDIAMQRFAIGILCMATAFVLWNAAVSIGWMRPTAVVPFLISATFLGGIALSKRFTPAMDFNTNLTALLLGTTGSLVSLPTAIEQGMGVVLGMAISYAAFAAPPDIASWRVRHVPARLLTMLTSISSDRLCIDRQSWEARISDLVGVIMIEMREKDFLTGRDSLRKCVLAMDIGIELIRLRDLSRINGLPCGLTTILESALRFAPFADAPDDAAAHLRASVEQLTGPSDPGEDPEQENLRWTAAEALDGIERCLHNWRETPRAAKPPV
ncbi:FUSC family protein [Paraburkholderia domus]|uniref:FUSC family protein n=1 Tax=Paraburkholderia domus TaxID=2793075 RepID=UPI00191280B6|nr:FUSC family protein [Paraburkholderia domus]MBK5185845.1 FUSC family protein [Burkholderia sp. R-69749]